MNDQRSSADTDRLSDVPLEDNQSATSTPSKTDQSTATVTSQPKSTGSGSKGFTRVALHMPFDEAHSEREWSSPLCSCTNTRGSCCWMCCCWPYYRYTVSVRLGETPFMPLIPCAAFALRVKMRALFSIKGSLIKDFFTSLCCEPCVVCQMMRELDSVGL
ncbi:cornifelin-like [Littorina saxatilis]|uniref:cornifelin-like n=1 Tax=Littorina saxatilis TaxID=31220 RepID=UPI0038B4C38C